MLVSIMDVVERANQSKKYLSGSHHCLRELKDARLGNKQIKFAFVSLIIARINNS